MGLKVGRVGGKRVANHLIMTDQPTAQGAGYSAPAPYDLFMASTRTRVGFYVQSYCENKGIDPSGIEISLSARRDPQTRQISGFLTTIQLPCEFPEKLHGALKKVAEQCAVKKAIMSNPEFVVETVSR